MSGEASNTPGSDHGFTLLEIITAIVLFGILAAMTVQFMASALEDATLPISRVQAEAGRVAIMEKITSDYVIEVNKTTPSDALTTMKSKADNGEYNAGGTTVTMTWIDFDGSGQEISGGTDYLKVSVKTGNAEILGVLSKSRSNATDPKVRF